MAVADGAAGAVTGSLWPGEAEYVAKAVDSRKSEFTAGRVLARRAIGMLGGAPAAIPPGSRGMPVWPAGYCGSISHAKGYVVAAAAATGDLRSIGIDVEEIGRFHAAMERHIARTDEIESLFDGRSPEDRQRALAIMFSAKEAFYKCQYPLSEQYLGFRQARVAIDEAAGYFELTLLAETAPFAAGQVFEGRFAVETGMVHAALVIA